VGRGCGIAWGGAKTPIGFQNDNWTHSPPPDGVDLTGRTAFTIVRDPAEWLVSWYRYLVQHEDSFRGRVYAGLMLEGCRRDSFEVFVGDYLEKMPGTVAETWLKFVDGVDFLLRTPFLREALQALFNKVEMTAHELDGFAPPVRQNATTDEVREQIPAGWTDEMRDAFLESERELYDWRAPPNEDHSSFYCLGGRARETVTA
jgi:hypothetical protein